MLYERANLQIENKVSPPATSELANDHTFSRMGSFQFESNLVFNLKVRVGLKFFPVKKFPILPIQEIGKNYFGQRIYPIYNEESFNDNSCRARVALIISL